MQQKAAAFFISFFLPWLIEKRSLRPRGENSTFYKIFYTFKEVCIDILNMFDKILDCLFDSFFFLCDVCSGEKTGISIYTFI